MSDTILEYDSINPVEVIEGEPEIKEVSGAEIAVDGAEACSCAPHKRESFKGYTIEQLRYRRAVTKLKIELNTDKLKMLVSPKVKKDVETVNGYVKNVEQIVRYIDYAVFAFNITRRLRGFLNRFTKGKR